MAKPADETKYGFSEDDDLLEGSMHELMEGLHSKDMKMILDAIEAIVHAIQNKHSGVDDAEPHEKA